MPRSLRFALRAMSMIEVDAVAKTFRIPHIRRDTLREHIFSLFETRHFEQFRVLDGISFDVRQGETLGIMGRNGSGKSTLLKLIAGIYQPDAGVVRVTGGLTAILELGIGWNPELDAIDNIFLLGSAMGLSLREIRNSVEEILAFAELERFANLKVQHYSSGMASRLAYAVAFRAVREILILDEIFAVGDAAFRSRCEDRYRGLHAAGHTVVMVSHSPDTIERFCDRAILIDSGRIHAEGAAASVADEYLKLLTDRGTAPAGLPSEG
jgi:ABC-type polysaccharide/polyol phosphate transport system ATPase subunit